MASTSTVCISFVDCMGEVITQFCSLTLEDDGETVRLTSLEPNETYVSSVSFPLQPFIHAAQQQALVLFLSEGLGNDPAI